MAAYEESIPDLIRGTIRDSIGIVRDEISLARTEMREEVMRIKSGLITVAAAVGVGVLAVIMLLEAIAWAASYAFDWPTWAGFAIVALPLMVVAVVLGVMSRSMLARDRYMPKSVDTLKENAEWLRARTQS
jgi:Putative Actinobacterial Holin-X, holin superfamily III